MNITDVSIRNPVFAWMLMASTMLFGIVAIIAHRRQPVSRTSTIRTSRYRSAGPAPRRPPSSASCSSRSSRRSRRSRASSRCSPRPAPDNARITVVFDMSRNVDLALQDVQARVGAASASSRRTSRRPSVSKSNPDDQPILTIGVSGPFSRQVLADVARYQVQEKLQTVAGVGQITLNGYLDSQRPHLARREPARRRRASSPTTSSARIRTEHVEVPGGRSRPAAARSTCACSARPLDLDRVPQARRQARQAPRPSTSTTSPTSRTASRTSRRSRASTACRCRRSASSSSAARTPSRVAQGGPRQGRRDPAHAPRGHEGRGPLRLDGLHRGVGPRDRARARHGGRPHGASCAGSSSARSRARINVVLAIPMSLLGTVAVIYFLGFTLNTFTLLGLSLAVGLVVDDAVMVMENIYRHAEMGKDRVQAPRRRHEGDHVRRARRDARRHRHLPARHLHEGRHREVLLPVRRDALGRRAALVPRGDHARAGALRADPQAPRARTAARSAASSIARFGRARARSTRACSRGALRASRSRCSSRPFVFLACTLAARDGSSPPSSSRRRTRAASSVRLQTEAGATPDAAAPLIARAEEKLDEASRDREHALDAPGLVSGQITLTLVPPSERKMTRSAVLGVAPQGAPGHRRASARRSRIRRSRASARRRSLAGRLHRARLRLGRARHERARRCGRPRGERLRHRPQLRLPARRPGAPDRARSPPRDRPRREHRRSRHAR